jgi:hypothetical protein
VKQVLLQEYRIGCTNYSYSSSSSSSPDRIPGSIAICLPGQGWHLAFAIQQGSASTGAIALLEYSLF